MVLEYHASLGFTSVVLCLRCMYLKILIVHKMDDEPDMKQVWVVCSVSLSHSLLPSPQANSHAEMHLDVLVNLQL